jgi:hypothetical protein
MARSDGSDYKASQDIGQPHDVVDPERKAAATQSFRTFCEEYFPQRFNLTWSPDHLVVLSRMEEAVIHGGLFALAMSRGSGKTTLAEVLTLWATMTARHQFAALIGVNADHAGEMLEAIKVELESNDLLDEDWPEITHPVRCLEGKGNKAKGQHIEGVRTQIGWRKTVLIFPTVKGSPASAAIIKVAGINGRIRGMKHARPDGRSVRPSLVVLDDPQDDESAASDMQCRKRHRVITGAILGLAGPGKAITAVMPCTIIRPGDLSATLLDRDKSPQWTGQRFKLLNRFPDDMEKWDQYGAMRADEFRNGGNGHLATAWYGQQRDVMDKGALAAWPERFKPDELGPIQHAMNLYYLNREAFFAEYQNEPQEETLGEGQLQKDILAERLNGIDRGTVPIWADHLTAFVDVQKDCLWYVVAAWRKDFTGAIVDYGAYPDQGRSYFTQRDVQRTLAKLSPASGLEATILYGLQRCSELLLQRDWLRQGGGICRVEKLLVDANWGESTNIVYEFCRTSQHAAMIVPSHGRGIGPDQKPMSEYQRKPGEYIGTYWHLTAREGQRGIRHVNIDTNWWKSFIAERLMTAMGDKGALTLPGQKGTDHRMLCDHLTAEYRVPTQGRGRRVDVWRMRPDKEDNHLLDGLVGAAVAASMLGANLLVNQGPAATRKSSREEYEKKRAAFEARRAAGPVASRGKHDRSNVTSRPAEPKARTTPLT